jgi:hypothetical protein
VYEPQVQYFVRVTPGMRKRGEKQWAAWLERASYDQRIEMHNAIYKLEKSGEQWTEFARAYYDYLDRTWEQRRIH